MAANYLEVEEFKIAAELIGTTFADYDIEQAIQAAQWSIEDYTGRFFYSGTQTRIYEWCGERCIEIDDFTSIGTVSLDYNRDGTYETTWTQGTEFLVQPFNAALVSKPYEELELLPVAWYHRPYPYPALLKVVGTFGWPAVPPSVKHATIIIASRLLKRAREAPFGIVGLGVDGSAVRISKVDVEVAFLLDPLIKGDGVMAA